MSQAEAKHFADDLKSKPKALAGLPGEAAGIAAAAVA
jgi:hypothetical protein